MKNLKWTKSYCGVSHLGELDHTNVRVTVTEYSNHSELKRFPRDFAPSIRSDYKTLAAAKEAGLAWMKRNYSENMYVAAAKKARNKS